MIRVLIVEDDAVIRRIAISLFERLNCDATAANNGVEAISLFSPSWDMVFMDCQMPVMDGFETTRQWRLLESAQSPDLHIPIVALTAESGQSEKERCRNAGMDDFLPKPLLLEPLRRIIDLWANSSETPGSKGDPMDSFETLTREYAGFETLLHELALGYLEEWPKRLLEIEEHLSHENLQAVSELAHKFKGQSLTMHFHNLSQALENLEAEARRGNLSASIGLLPGIRNNCHFCCTQLVKFLNSSRAP